MPVIKDNQLINDDWTLYRDLAENPDLQSLKNKSIIPLATWQAHQAQLLESRNEFGIWVDGSAEIETLCDDLKHFPIIGLDFPSFKDGRAYSHAYLLRQRYHYKGELRAIGDVLPDQLFFMHRCGIDSYDIQNKAHISNALKKLEGFSYVYQNSVDAQRPIFKLRHSQSNK